MAHNIIGLDLGSHSVKSSSIRLGIRGPEIIRMDSEPVVLDEEGRSSPEEVMAAAGRLIKQVAEVEDTVHCSVPGEAVSLRSVKLPKAAAKRASEVLKYELDETIPYSIGDAVFDFIEVGKSDEEVSFLCAVSRSSTVGDLIEGLTERGVDPREIGVVGLSYAALAEDTSYNFPTDKVVAIVDLGHQRTDISVHGDEVITTRTLLRGGRDLSQSISAKWNLTFEDGQKYKERDGLFGQVGEQLKLATKPLVREIKQTLKGHEASGGNPVNQVLLVGGGACLKGIDELLASELNIPTEVYAGTHKTDKGTLSTEDSLRGTLSLALSLREAMPKLKTMNLRQGEYAFKGDFEYLKKRLGWIAACLAGILCSWIFSNYAEYTMLKSRSDELKVQLADITKETFGKPLFTKDLITAELTSLTMEKPPIPKKDAFDIVVELSERIPTSVIHDVEMLEIKPKRLTLKGIVDPELRSEGGPKSGEETEEEETQLSSIDFIKQELAKYTECFKSIRVGKVTVMGERRKYQMDIDTTCP